jgi:hypothetical protein
MFERGAGTCVRRAIYRQVLCLEYYALRVSPSGMICLNVSAVLTVDTIIMVY